jgi:DNA-binding PadR family transcriptional regulator
MRGRVLVPAGEEAVDREEPALRRHDEARPTSSLGHRAIRVRADQGVRSLRQLPLARRPGQIYPELSCLADAGLIRQTSNGPRGAKRFEATEQGIAELRRWITDVEPAGGIRNETLLRVFFAYLVDSADAEAFLRRTAEEYRCRLEILERFADEPSPKTPSERASALTVDAGIRALKANIEWAKAAIDQVLTW